jgi:hypothetical protein
MMKYICLAYHDEDKIDALSGGELGALIEETLAYNEELRRSGQLAAAEALQSARTSVIVCVRDGQVSVTDGPFAKTKEQLGGFFVLNARDLNEAIHLASRMAQARVGSLEVRPIRELT